MFKASTNYAAYRKSIRRRQKMREHSLLAVPVVLKDVTLMDEGQPSWMDDARTALK